MVERRIEKSKEGGLCAQAIRDFVSHPFFEAFILFTILLNAAFMAVIGPEPRPGSVNMEIIYYSSLFFTPLYTAEGLLKIAGFGLVRDERSYFRDPWCIFDGGVILVSWIDLIMTSGSGPDESSESSNLLVIRLVRFIRVLRVARAASKLSATKLMVEVVVRGLYNSRYVFLIIFFFIIFNCTLGLSWFSQDLRYRCTVVEGIEDANGTRYELSKAEYDRLDKGAEYWTDVTTAPHIFAVPEAFCRHRSRPFANVGKQCEEAEGFMCVLVKEEAFDGLLNFENFGKTFLTVIMTLMQQEWEKVMIATMEGTAPPACIFFVFIVLFGSLFLMEYTTAVLCITFVEVSKTMNALPAQHNRNSPGRDHFDQALVQVHMGEIQDAPARGEGGASERAATAEGFAGASVLDVTDAGSRPGRGNLNLKALDGPGAGAGTGGGGEESGAQELSFPLVGFEVNQDAFRRIRARALAANANPTWTDHVAAVFDAVAYGAAGIIMYPACPCEINAAGGESGFSGADDTGQIALWEMAVTALSASQVIFSLLSSSDLVAERKLGREPAYDAYIQWMFLVPFLLDTVFKMIAFKGPRGYFGSILNQMDFWVTFTLFIGLLSWQRPDFSGFRIFRCLRILSLSRFSEIGTLLHRAFGSLLHALNAVALTSFFVVILAIIGQQIFAGADGTGFSRMYFGSFYLSIISMTELSTKSGLFQMIRQGLTTGVHTSVFLVLGCFLMNMIVLKLMIPLIVSRFEEAEAFKIQYQLFFGKIMGGVTQPWDATTEHQQARDVFHQADHTTVDELQDEDSQANAADHSHQSLLKSVGNMFARLVTSDTRAPQAQARGKVQRAVYLWEKTKEEEMKRTLTTDLSFRQSRNDGSHINGASSLTSTADDFKSGLIRFKKRVKKVLNRKEFDMCMGAIILVAAVMASLCTSIQCIIPVRTGNTLESIFTVVFSLEFCAKIFAFGLFTSTTGYFLSWWNWLDFLVLVTMWAGVLGLSSVKGAQSLRLLRLIRVIMLLRFFPAIKNAFLGLATVRKDVMKVFTLVVALLLVFVCIAMQMYGGLLWKCSDQDASGRVDCSGFYLAGAKYGSDSGTGRVPVLMPRVWNQKPDHFDDVGNAMISSFFLFLNYDWTDMIERSMSITGPNKQHELMANPVYGMPFVICQLVINIMIWQLIVSVVISSVRHADGSAFMTEDQKAWAATKRQIVSKYEQFKKERLKGSYMAHSIASNAWFEMLVNVTILINIATMLSDYYGISREQQQTALAINTGCLVVYYVEMVVTILANPINYFLDASRLFDFVINIISTVDAVSTWASKSGSAGSVGIQALKALRVLRIARMVNRNPAVSIMIKSTIKSFDRAMGCFAIWGIITLLFALWAVQLFAGVKQGYTVDPANDANFNDMPRALLWLLRISVGSNVFHVIEDLEVSGSGCTQASAESNGLTDCGPGKALTRAFFIIFCFLCRFTLFPLVAGTIVNSFFSTVDDVRALIKAQDIEKFETAWRSMDPEETGYIAAWKFQPLMEHLRSRNSVLWFDASTHPGKMSKLSAMLNEAMLEIREEIAAKMQSSAIHGIKLKDDPGLLPGQLRFDCVFLHLVAFSAYPHALHVPATEQLCMVEKVCAATFNHFMRKNAGDIRRRIKMDARAKAPQHKADPLVHQHSMALPTRKDSNNTAMPTPRDRLISRSEALEAGSVGGSRRGSEMRFTEELSVSSEGSLSEGDSLVSRRDIMPPGLELTSAAPTKRLGAGLHSPPISEDWDDDRASAISKVTSSEQMSSPGGRAARSNDPDWYSTRSSITMASAARLPDVDADFEHGVGGPDMASEVLFVFVETDHQIVAADKAGRTPFANRMLLDLALALDIKTEQVEIRNMSAVDDLQVRIAVVLAPDPDGEDSRQPRQLAKALRLQSMDANSDLMVLIPQVASVVLKDGKGSQSASVKEGGGGGGGGVLRSNGNPLHVPENVILQRHARLLQQHLSAIVAEGGSHLSHTAAEPTLDPRRRGHDGGDQNPPGDPLTEGIKTFVGKTSSVVQSLTPHVMPFLPGKRGFTYAWKGGR